LLNTTASLMRSKGAAATGTKEILDGAAAPRGSFYFHFPEGKDQLVLAALEQAAAETLAMVEKSLTGDGRIVDQVRAIFETIEAELIATDYAAGCAVAVTTVESASTSAQFQHAVSAAFGTWTTALISRLSQRGVPHAQAIELSDAVVAMMEGATILARARREPQPLRNAALVLELAIEAAMRQSPTPDEDQQAHKEEDEHQ
jgi:TetR/AcrR family transcriptional repressor of lmrAB and yxaGH operons